MILRNKILLDKHCFVYCGPERCNCKAGNPELWKLQNPCQHEWEPFGESHYCSLQCKKCGDIRSPEEVYGE